MYYLTELIRRVVWFAGGYTPSQKNELKISKKGSNILDRTPASSSSSTASASAGSSGGGAAKSADDGKALALAQEALEKVTEVIVLLMVVSQLCHSFYY